VSCKSAVSCVAVGYAYTEYASAAQLVSADGMRIVTLSDHPAEMLAGAVPSSP
jgi:hypothetical protein